MQKIPTKLYISLFYLIALYFSQQKKKDPFLVKKLNLFMKKAEKKPLF